MTITKDEALDLLRLVLSVGEWDQAWLMGVERLAELFPEHPWIGYVEDLVQTGDDDAYSWRSVLDARGFLIEAGVYDGP